MDVSGFHFPSGHSILLGRYFHGGALASEFCGRHFDLCSRRFDQDALAVKRYNQPVFDDDHSYCSMSQV